MKRLAAAMLSLALLGGAAATAYAVDVDAQRESIMKEMGKTMKGLAAIAKGQAPFDANSVKAGGELIVKDLETFGTLFDPGTETNASEGPAPEIWTDRAGFDAARNNAITAAQKLAMADEAGFGDALKELGGTCAACHKKYRLSN